MSSDVAKASPVSLNAASSTLEASSSEAPKVGSEEGAHEANETSPKPRSEVPENKRKRAVFSEDTASILAKYASAPASLELHIHQTHYRFSGQEGVIPKGNPVIELFLESVREGVLPAVASEVFRDSGITLYEGCAILKLVDYRDFSSNANSKQNRDFDKPEQEFGQKEKLNGTEVPKNLDIKKEQTNPLSKEQPTDSSDNTHKTITVSKNSASSKPNANADSAGSDGTESQPQPPSYRILLQPTGSSLLNDLMGLSDAGTGRRLTDFFAMSMESEILNTTIRNIDFRIPDSAQFNAGLRGALALSNGKRRSSYIKHRLTHPRKLRKMVEDSPHKGSAYEDFMLAMADLDRPVRGSSQFVRMSFIEQLRRKKNIDPPGAASSLSGSKGPHASQLANAPSNAQNISNQTLSTPTTSSPSLNLPPTKISQPSPSQLGRQLHQSHQIAQQSSRMQQQAMSNQLSMNHVPPGPTAQHQIQAQQQQQAILRARAQQQMMRQNSLAQNHNAPRGQQARVQGSPNPQAQPNPTIQRPVSSSSAVGPNGQHVTRPVQRMNKPNAMQLQNGMQNQMNPMSNQMSPMQNQMNSMNGSMGGQMNGQMGLNSQMGQMGQNQMGQMGQMGGQMSNQMSTQMGNQLNGQIGNHMGNQMGMNQMGMMGNQMNSQMGSQMGSPINSAMTSPMNHSMTLNNGMGGQMGNQMNSQMNNMMGQMGSMNQMNQGQMGQMNNQMANQMGNQMGNSQMGNNQMGNQMGNQMNSPMGMTSPHLGNQQSNGMGMNQMGINQMASKQMHGMNNTGMSPMMGNQRSPSGSPMQVPVRGTAQMSGPMGGMPMPQQIPTQAPSQLQQMQGRRPSQLTQAQMRQLMINRARAQQQAQAMHGQNSQLQDQPSSQGVAPYSPDMM